MDRPEFWVGVIVGTVFLASTIVMTEAWNLLRPRMRIPEPDEPERRLYDLSTEEGRRAKEYIDRSIERHKPK